MADRTQEVHEFPREKICISIFTRLKLQFITSYNYECNLQSKGALAVPVIFVVSSSYCYFHITLQLLGIS